jgi:hypothetical protein
MRPLGTQRRDAICVYGYWRAEEVDVFVDAIDSSEQQER